MSQVPPTPSISSLANFQSVFNAALERYENKTKKELLTHPLSAQLQSCDSPAAILSLLQGLVQQFDQGRSSDERLNSWLNLAQPNSKRPLRSPPLLVRVPAW
jgi:hypothetical protein